MKIYIMRHGTTVWNEQHKTQGLSQNRLSRAGISLVETASKDFANTIIDVIYSSPLMRTMQTANIMNKYHNVKIKKDDRLIEIDKGIFTGRFAKTLTEKEKQLRSINHPSCKMESYGHVYERVKAFVCELKNNSKFENILIVTHGVVARFLYAVLTDEKIDVNNSEAFHKFANAEIREVEIKN